MKRYYSYGGFDIDMSKDQRSTYYEAMHLKACRLRNPQKVLPMWEEPK